MPTPAPFITFIVSASLDSAEFLKKLHEVYQARVDSYEIIVVPNRQSLCAEDDLLFQIPNNLTVRFVPITHAGIGAALNQAIEKSSGEWIVVLHSEPYLDQRDLDQFLNCVSLCPDCNFMCSNYWSNPNACLCEKESCFTEFDPETPYPILELFHNQISSPTCYCFRRDVIVKVGRYDENFTRAYEYDFLLRLFSSYHCKSLGLARTADDWNACPTSDILPQIHYDECTRASVQFLNDNTFSKFSGASDVSSVRGQAILLKKALDVASDSSCRFLYSLGYHPALLMRILEWAWSFGDSTDGKILKETARTQIAETASRYHGTAFGLIWKTALAAVQVPTIRFSYSNIDPETIANSPYWKFDDTAASCKTRLDRHPGESRGSEPVEFAGFRIKSGMTNGNSCKRLTACCNSSNVLEPCTRQRVRGISRNPDHTAHRQSTVVFVCQRGQNVSDSVKYGALRAAHEVATHLLNSGIGTVLAGFGDIGLAVNDGVLCVALPNDETIVHLVDFLEPLDALIGVCRGDVALMGKKVGRLVYHHNASPVDGLLLRTIMNGLRIPVATVSHASKQQQISFGVRSALLHVVRNGIDSKAFFYQGDQPRRSRGIIYAGYVVASKGFDTALGAFNIVKKYYSETTLEVYGKVYNPPSLELTAMHRSWLDSSGVPQWDVIEKALPGFRYMGESPQPVLAQAFRRNSILVMPSRLAETFGLASVEAQACGCIPVLPRVGGFPETMRENVTGYLYDENTPEGLAKKILQIWSNDLPKEDQRKEAARWVRQTFSWERTGREMLELIESLPSRENGAQIPFKRLLAHIANMEREIRRVGRGARFAFTTLKEKSPSEWPAIVCDLWTEYARRRQIY